MAREVQIKVELLTEEAFAPFGALLSNKERSADFQGLNSIGWKEAFELNGPPLFMTLSSSYTGLRFNMLERHFAVTQTFIPLGGVPSIIAVAAPSAPETIPAPEDIRAFVLDGSAGYVLKKGTWHSLDRFPLYPPSAEIVIISSLETQQELESVPQEQWRLTQQIDYTEQFDVSFKLEL